MMNDTLPEDLQALTRRLPAKFRRPFRQHPDLSEATLQIGRPMTVSWGDWERPYVEYPDLVPTREDIQRIAHQFAGIKEDGRAGIAGTAHRISAIFDRADNIVGFTVRVARHFPKALPDSLKDELLRGKGSVLIVGAPGSGKTTLLRAVAAALSQTRSGVLVKRPLRSSGMRVGIKCPALRSSQRSFDAPSPTTGLWSLFWTRLVTTETCPR